MQTYTNSDVLGRGKEPINEHTHEGCVQAIFDGELGQLGICHGLGNHDGADSDTYGAGS